MPGSRRLLLGGACAAMIIAILLATLPRISGLTVAAVNRTPTPAVRTPVLATTTATPLSTATATATVGPAFPAVVAVKPVPAGVRLEGIASFGTYFKEQPLLGLVPFDAVQGLQELQTRVLSGTTLIGALQIRKDLPRGAILHSSDYRVIHFSPPGSLAYQIGVGRVAISIQVPPLAADNGVILPGDTVDLLLTIRQHETDSLTSSPPVSTQAGAMETQQLLQNVRVLAVQPLGIYTLELPLQEALIVKYVRDTSGLVDLVLEAATTVRTQAPQPATNAIYPEFFLTPVLVQGTAVAGSTPLPTPVSGVSYPFTPVKPTRVVVSTAPGIVVQPSSPFQSPKTPVPTGAVVYPIINP